MRNLWHELGTFMDPSPTPGSLDPCVYSKDHQSYLELAADPSSARLILPGPGASNYGTRLPGWPPHPEPSGGTFEKPAPRRPPLRLAISLSHASCWSFEPVALDIALSVTGRTSVEIPDEIDPGYSRFRIWITNPTGERRQFRPQMRFCHDNGTTIIAPGRPYRRDLPIFRQPGSDTFAVPGTYRVQVALRLGRDEIFSNEVCCEVLAAAPRRREWQHARTILSPAPVRDLLRFRERLPSAGHVARLQTLATARGLNRATVAAVHYALGAAMVSDEPYPSRAGPAANQRRTLAATLLARARDPDRLGSHCNRKVSALLAQLAEV